MKTLPFILLLLFLTGCSTNTIFCSLFPYRSGDVICQDPTAIKQKPKSKKKYEAEPLPFENISLIGLEEGLSKDKRCSELGTVSTEKGKPFQSKTDYEYGIEQLLVQADVLKGNLLKIEAKEPAKLKGKVYACSDL